MVFDGFCMHRRIEVDEKKLQLRPPLALWQPPGAVKRPHPEGCRLSCRSNEGMSCWGHQTYLHQPWSPANCHSPHKFETSCKCGRVLNCIFELSSNDILMYLDDQVHISLQSKWSQNTWSDSRFPIPKNPACSIPSAGAVASQNIHKQTIFSNSDAPRIFTSLINLGLTTPVAKSLNTACLSLSSGKVWNMWKVYEREKQKLAMHGDAKNDRESVTTCHNIQGICFQLMGQSSLFRALSTCLAVLSSWRPGAWRLKISMVFTKWAQPSAHTFLKTTERQTPCLKEARSANWALWEGSVLSTNNSKTFHTYSRRKMKFRIANKAKNYQKLSGLSRARFFLCSGG